MRDGKPVTRDLARDLDAKIDQLILFLVNKRMERHEKWHVRLTAVLGQGPGRVAVVHGGDTRRKIERRLFAFGATKFTRRYPKRQKAETARDQFQAAMGDILARVSDPDRVAKAAAELKVIMSDTLDRIAANAAAGIGPRPGPGA